ncbi:hypothetical protein F5Y18DRAFT_416665 [Xylariaceae sp. FL1019]|nr:hypothetical protein F5Y18DRAFT_416665 [Xylariaceae sp. FL1019]
MGLGRYDKQDETLVSALERLGSKAFRPDSDASSRAAGQRDFAALISRTGTMALMSSVNTLIKPGRVADWLRIHLMDVLTLLPQRPDGVRTTMEFVFSVHPSSTVSASEFAATQKQGANITMEALRMASTLLTVPPVTVRPEAWFPGVAPQLLKLLDGTEGNDLTKAAAYVIGYGVLGRRQFGAPGTVGWNVFVEPMIACIDPSLSSQDTAAEPLVFCAGPDKVVDLRKETVLVPADALCTGLKRLTSLLHSHPNPGLTKRLLQPLLLPLWALSAWQTSDEQVSERYRRPAQRLLDIYLRLAGSADKLETILDNLQFNGRLNLDESHWAYQESGNSQIQILRLQDDSMDSSGFETLEAKTSSYIDLLRRIGSDSAIPSLFIKLLGVVLAQMKGPTGIQLTAQDDRNDDPILQLSRTRVLEKMMEELSDRLISNPTQLLDLVDKILKDFNSELGNDDAVPVALSLLNLVVTVPSFQRKDITEEILDSIESSLAKIIQSSDSDVSKTAYNLSLFLKFRDELDDPADRPTAPTQRQVEDRKTYNLALSYITQADSPPPVRAEGLNLLGTLVKANSAIIDIPATLVLLSSLLNDDDEYISLSVIRSFVQLAERHPRSTVSEVLEQYVDTAERLSTDTRLRFGEALLQLMQRLGETFSGELSATVGEALIALAGRRAHRTKTEERQTRAERLAMQKLEAQGKMKAKISTDLIARISGDEKDDDDSDLDLEDQTPEQRAQNAILARIVSGWESKRGSEDMRVRASALSLFTSGLETNMRAFTSQLVDAALALSLDVLVLESGLLEAGILRRAAVMLTLTFVRVLGEARREGGSGLNTGGVFGTEFTTSEADVVRILMYVEQADDDELVRQHARDAIENLQNLRLVQLVPSQAAATPGIMRIAGLDISTPKVSLGSRPSGGVNRPKIEEIE